jgi:hypothetical protein
LYIYITPGCSLVDPCTYLVPCVVQSSHVEHKDQTIAPAPTQSGTSRPHLHLLHPPLSTLFIGLGFHHTSFWPPLVPSATSRVLLPIGIHLRMTRHQDPTCAWVPSGGRFHGHRFLIKHPAAASVWSVVHRDDDHKRGGDSALITAIILSTWRFCVVTRIESG